MSGGPLVIVGGGCAGLALARELAHAECRGETIPEVVVIEPRTHWSRDRTWCFWTDGSINGVDHLIRRRWPAWSFSTLESRAVHRSARWSYVCVPSDDYYRDALTAVASSRKIALQRGTGVESIRPGPDSVVVSTTSGLLRAAHVIDTRPPARDDVAASTLQQIFVGVEVQLREPVEQPDVVGLMESMACDGHGFRFDYVLPLAPTRLLVESTRFAAVDVPRRRMALDLDEALARVAPPAPYEILRREAGCIPMGLPVTPTIHSRWLKAGTAGGAVRPATGYAFLRIQEWARQCARDVVRSGRPIAQPAPSRSLRWMDRLFLSLLRKRPALAPTLFMAMARGVSTDALARFLSERASPGDLLSVVRSLPAGPFLGEIRRQVEAVVRRRPAA